MTFFFRTLIYEKSNMSDDNSTEVTQVFFADHDHLLGNGKTVRDFYYEKTGVNLDPATIVYISYDPNRLILGEVGQLHGYTLETPPKYTRIVVLEKTVIISKEKGVYEIACIVQPSPEMDIIDRDKLVQATMESEPAMRNSGYGVLCSNGYRLDYRSCSVYFKEGGDLTRYQKTVAWLMHVKARSLSIKGEDERMSVTDYFRNSGLSLIPGHPADFVSISLPDKEGNAFAKPPHVEDKSKYNGYVRKTENILFMPDENGSMCFQSAGIVCEFKERCFVMQCPHVVHGTPKQGKHNGVAMVYETKPRILKQFQSECKVRLRDLGLKDIISQLKRSSKKSDIGTLLQYVVANGYFNAYRRNDPYIKFERQFCRSHPKLMKKLKKIENLEIVGLKRKRRLGD